MKQIQLLTRILLATLLIPAGVFAQNTSSDATTLYVDSQIVTSGCDEYDPIKRVCTGGNFKAYAEIATAAKTLSPGITVLIQPGTYQGGIIVQTSGRDSTPITLRATGPGVTIEGTEGSRDAFFISEADYIEVDGLTIKNATRAALRISRSNHVTVRNSTFADNGSWGVFTDFSNHTTIENSEAYGSQRQHGIYISNSSDFAIIRGNRIHHNAAAGLHMNGDISMGGDGIVSNAIIENNIIYENGKRGGSGINMDGVTHSIVRNNLLYENHASGISLYQIDGGSESHDNLVVNNTIIMARFARWALNIPNTGNTRVFNNVILNRNLFRGSISVGSPVSPGFESDYNIVMDSFAADGEGNRRMALQEWQSLGYDQNSHIASAAEVFVDPHGNDFQLKAGSPAINTGINLDDVMTDLNNVARPLGAGYDIGAYER